MTHVSVIPRLKMRRANISSLPHSTATFQILSSRQGMTSNQRTTRAVSNRSPGLCDIVGGGA